MSYLLSGKVQTCYSNNVFCKIKIFEYLETGRYEDYRPRHGLKFLSPKNRNFRWIDLFSDYPSNYRFLTSHRKIENFGKSNSFQTIRQIIDFWQVTGKYESYRKIEIFGESICFRTILQIIEKSVFSVYR